ncbi:hypothetical protein Tco_1410320 [Tanacetum coccineum]
MTPQSTGLSFHTHNKVMGSSLPSDRNTKSVGIISTLQLDLFVESKKIVSHAEAGNFKRFRVSEDEGLHKRVYGQRLPSSSVSVVSRIIYEDLLRLENWDLEGIGLSHGKWQNLFCYELNRFEICTGKQVESNARYSAFKIKELEQDKPADPPISLLSDVHDKVADVNLLSMGVTSQNNVLFTETECLVLSKDFKLPDNSQVVLRVLRRHNLYSFNMNELQPEDKLCCPCNKGKHTKASYKEPSLLLSTIIEPL